MAEGKGPPWPTSIDVGKRAHSARALDEGGAVVFRAVLENGARRHRPASARRRGRWSSSTRSATSARWSHPRVRARQPCAYLPGCAERQAAACSGRRQDRRHRRRVIARTARGMPERSGRWPRSPRGPRPAHPVVAARVRDAAHRGRRTAARDAAGGRSALRRAVDLPRLAGGAARRVRPAAVPAVSWRRFSAAAGRAGAPPRAPARSEAMLRLSGVRQDPPRRRGRRGPHARARDRRARRRRRARGARRRLARRQRCLRVPAHGPRIGPKTAAALVTSVDISMFRGHDELASYCGVAPVDSRSGTSVRSTSPCSAAENKQLKEPADIQLHLAHRHEQQVRKVLRRVQGGG